MSLNVVWDLGRVLLRWRPEQVLRETLPHIVTDAASAVHWAQQIFQSYGGDWGDFDRGTVSRDDLVLRIARRTGLSTADVQRVVDAALLELQPMPDSVALLRRLHAAGCGLYFLSNMPAPFADHLERSHAELRLFRDGVFSGRVHHNKPEPEIFRIAQQRFGVPAQALVFLDDHEPNVIAARAAGWRAFVFTSAAQAEADLRSAGLLRLALPSDQAG